MTPGRPRTRFGFWTARMALLALLGMHPIAAYPIMMGSDGILQPVASLGFFKSGRFAHGPSLGLTIGGVVGCTQKLAAPPRPVDPDFPFPFRRDEFDVEGPVLPAGALYWLLVCFGLATVLIFAGMPWPGRPGGRPLFRGL